MIRVVLILSLWLAIVVSLCRNDYCDCSNNGKCVAGQCVCGTNYYGEHCEVAKSYGMACVTNADCINGGTCNVITKHCDCLPGWGGAFCEYANPRDAICTDTYNDCFNNGACNLQTGKCVCSSGYYGNQCALPRNIGQPCAPGLCKNGGNCSREATKCICAPGWTGDYCEIESGGYFCQSSYSDCNNNGICDGSTGHCICSSSYYGKACEVPVSADAVCGPASCQNGGFCASFKKCICPPAWTGSFCEYPSGGFVCRSTYSGCSNNGYCDFASGHCKCISSWYGVYCEVAASAGAPCAEGLCQNNGTCSQATQRCICAPGWTGNYCDVRQPNNGDWGCQSTYCDCNNRGYCNQATGTCICTSGIAPQCS